MKERLENTDKRGKRRRKEDADYFNSYKEILEDALGRRKERKKLGFTTCFEFAVYEELLKLLKYKKTKQKITYKNIIDRNKGRNRNCGLETKTSSDKQYCNIIVYDLLD